MGGSPCPCGWLSILYPKLSCVLCVSVPGGMGEVVFNSYGKSIIFGKESFLEESCGRLTPSRNTSVIISIPRNRDS